MLPVRSRREKRCFFPIYRACPISQIMLPFHEIMCVSRFEHDLINKNKVSFKDSRPKEPPPFDPGKAPPNPEISPQRRFS